MFTEDLTPFFSIEDFGVNISFDNPDRREPSAFGSALSLSADTLVVGSRLSDSDNKGVVFVFEKTVDNTWEQQTFLQPSGLSANAHFGQSVSIENDTLVVGCPGENSVYIYTRANGVWNFSQKIEPDDAVGSSSFGYHVAISGDYLTVSDPYDDNYKGAVYVYYLSTTWQKVAKLIGSDSVSFDNFGRSLDFDYRTIVIGCYNSAGDTKGAVYVFYRDSGTGLSSVWLQQEKLQPSELSSGDHLSYDLSYDNDYQTLIISTPNYNFNSGAVFVYTRSSGIWAKRVVIESPIPTPGEYFGYHVSHYPGSIIVNSWGDGDGKLYEYSGSSSSWSLTNEFASDSINMISDVVLISSDDEIFFNNQDDEFYSFPYDAGYPDTPVQIEYISRYGDFKGIFDHEYVAVNNGDLSYEGYKPTIICRTEDLKAVDLGTFMTVEDFDPTLKVISNQPDGTGVSVLILHKV